MTSLPTNRPSSTSLPAPQDLATGRLILSLSNRLERGPTGGNSISDRQLPSNSEYAALRRRAGDLRASLAPADTKAILAAVSAVLIGHHASRGASPEQATAQLRIFTEVLSDLPVWAVQSGCGDLIRKDVAWPPSAGQVRAACMAACQGARDELARADAILNADVYHEPDADERAKVKAGYEKLVDDLKLNAPTDPLRPKEQRPPTRDEALAWLDREKGKPLPPISDSLRHSFGMEQREENRREDAA